MEIVVKLKNTYGMDRIYPVCDTAKKLTQLMHQSTFTFEDIKLIKSMQIEVKVEQKAVTL